MFQTDIYHAIETGQIKGLWLIATNPFIVMPNSERIRRAMQKAGILRGAGLLSGYRVCAVRQRVSACRHLGGKRRRHDQYRTAHQSGQTDLQPPAEAKPDLWIFNQMAKRFNQGGQGQVSRKKQRTSSWKWPVFPKAAWPISPA